MGRTDVWVRTSTIAGVEEGVATENVAVVGEVVAAEVLAAE